MIIMEVKKQKGIKENQMAFNYVVNHSILNPVVQNSNQGLCLRKVMENLLEVIQKAMEKKTAFIIENISNHFKVQC